MIIDLIGVPFLLGNELLGVERAPQAIRDLGLTALLQQNGLSFVDRGNIILNNELSGTNINYNINNFTHIVKMAELLRNEVNKSLAEEHIPFIMGGDHSVSIGSLASSIRRFANLGVIWLDAHPDINTHYSSPSGNAHGMPLAMALGLGPQEITSLFTNLLKPSNIFILGARSIDHGEEEIIKKNNIKYFSQEQIAKRGLKSIIREISQIIRKNNITDLHLSFDVDVLDPSIIPGTGTPVAKGLFLEEVKIVLENLITTKLIRVIDFVEYNPLLDNKAQTSKTTIYSLLKIIFENLAKTKILEK